MSSIWYEKYKPQNLDELIIPETMRMALRKEIQDETLPNLGLWSVLPGLGKSSTAHAIIKELSGEALWINASLEKGIDTLRGKIQTFASQSSFDDKIKVVVLDECDHITQDSQAAFRGFLDEFSQSTRFIFTGNYKTKIIQPLLDRLQNYDYSEFSPKDIIPQLLKRLKFISSTEGLDLPDTELGRIIKTYYPKIRTMIGLLQTYKQTGTLKLSSDDYYLQVVQTLKDKDYTKMYQAVNSLVDPDSIYQYLYEHTEYLACLSKGVIILAKYQAMAPQVRDKYLNACACMLELMFLNSKEPR